MPPKVSFTKREVIRAGLEIVAELGFQGLSARKVAAKLRASTAPVYSCYASMDDLKKDILDAAKNVLLDYARESYTPDSFLNTGVGIVRFAGEQKDLFKALFLGVGEAQQMLDEFNCQWKAEMESDHRFADQAPDVAQMVFQRMGIVTYGMAVLACSDQYLGKTAEEIGCELVKWFNVICNQTC